MQRIGVIIYNRLAYKYYLPISWIVFTIEYNYLLPNDKSNTLRLDGRNNLAF